MQDTTIPSQKDVPSDYNSDELPDLVLPQTRSVITGSLILPNAHNDSSTEQTPSRTQLENISQLSTTPRSVLSDPGDTEIETTNTLLSLGSLENIDQAVDNETLLPMNKPHTEDFTKELAAQECMQSEQSADDSDSDSTVAYGDTQSVKSVTIEEQRSPKGVVKYKHYGIKRQSPSKTKVRRLRCFICDAIFDSK